MLVARRKSDGKIVEAYFETKQYGPYYCPVCNELVALRIGAKKVNHFAHVDPFACQYAQGESDAHRNCKQEIYASLLPSSRVSKLALERPLGEVRPDVSAYIDGVPVAIEVQISSLSVDKIKQRTASYTRKGIHVLWLLQWKPELDKQKYSPEPWEKWLHTLYYGHVYYWTSSLSVVSYRFEPCFISVRQTSWFSGGIRRTAGGYSKRSKRHKTAVKEGIFDILRDFQPKVRDWFEMKGQIAPVSKLFLPNRFKDDSDSFSA